MPPTDPMTPQRLREIVREGMLNPYGRMAQELRAHADQLERNAWQPISTAPKPNDKPYSPSPDRRCERCDRIIGKEAK